MFGLERCRSLTRSKRLILVRDPRDALVSHYYSIRQSHVLPAKGNNRRNMLKAREQAANTGIDQFITQVRRGKFICKTMLSLSRLNGPDTHVYKYEDVIFNKAAWLRDMLSRIDIGQLDDGLIEETAARNDVVPEDEDPSRHIRQVKPGNYRNHLSPETIGWIEREYSAVFDTYGYPKSSTG